MNRNIFADSDTHFVDAIEEKTSIAELDNYNPFQVWCNNASIEELQSALTTLSDAEEIAMVNATLNGSRSNRVTPRLNN